MSDLWDVMLREVAHEIAAFCFVLFVYSLSGNIYLETLIFPELWYADSFVVSVPILPSP